MVTSAILNMTKMRYRIAQICKTSGNRMAIPFGEKQQSDSSLNQQALVAMIKDKKCFS